MTLRGERDQGVKHHPWVSGLHSLAEMDGDAIGDGEMLVWEVRNARNPERSARLSAKPHPTG